MSVQANDPRDQWSVFHFSQANSAGDGQDDVPALLRRVADTIEERGEIDVMDITFEKEITAEGPWPSLTVYYHRRDLQSSD